MRRSGQEAQHNSDLRMMHESAAARRRTNAFALGEHAIGDVQMEGHNRPEDMEIKMKKWDVCDRSVVGHDHGILEHLRPNNPQKTTNPRPP